MSSPADAGDGFLSDLYGLDSSDPEGALVDRAAMSADDVEQIGGLMNAMGRMRRAEDALSEASLRYMRLNKTDMKALHFLIVSANRGVPATPGSIAAALGISSASTTKLLDRLEAGGHIVRGPHPTDRRALTVAITDETRAAATDTIGRQHAKRARVAAALTAEERAIVTRFFDAMADAIALDDEDWTR